MLMGTDDTAIDMMNLPVQLPVSISKLAATTGESDSIYHYAASDRTDLIPFPLAP